MHPGARSPPPLPFAGETEAARGVFHPIASDPENCDDLPAVVASTLLEGPVPGPDGASRGTFPGTSQWREGKWEVVGPVLPRGQGQQRLHAREAGGRQTPRLSCARWTVEPSPPHGAQA